MVAYEAMVIAPEAVHLSRFSSRFGAVCIETKSDIYACVMQMWRSRNPSSVHRWHMPQSRMVTSILQITGQDMTGTHVQPQHAMQFVMQPTTIQVLLEQRPMLGIGRYASRAK
jgi:hypothetical protein